MGVESPHPEDVSEEDLFAFVVRSATQEQWQRVRDALQDPNSYAARWIKELHNATANPLNINLTNPVDPDAKERKKNDT